ncbi:MAG: zinc-dependent metalloprotease [Candidatus Pseudobacter hemicellulosilyticus]|uniref:Zinc-dependent metalloprotease n=1 Tax=Candidatus Pseudobacter hemicellulosilyticus TaxID=3121375 RepID=A0AAJ6BGF6_9BACT|nr:MAG: zinc-dependent metalloprotease [Pseudobacter sp.]
MNTRALLLFICLILAGAATDTQAQSRKKKEKQKKEQQAARDKAVKDSLAKITPYERLLKDPQKTAKGLMNLYYVKSKLYLELPMSLMGKNLLLASTISEISDNYDGIVGSKQNPMQVQFSKVDSSILLRKIETGTITPASDTTIQQALDINSIGAIIKVFPVQAYNKDRSTAVIDVTEYFAGDVKELSPFGIFSVYGAYGLKSTPSFKRDRSFIGEIKSFSDNVMIKSHLSYETSIGDGKRTLVKDNPFTAVMTRTFVLLPEQPLRPRVADSRIGIFTTSKNQLSDAVNRTEAVYFANRWRLEPKDAAAYQRGELVEPVQPIIFYVDSDFPQSWKQPIKKAVEDWQLTFEKIGFKNAILALDYPKGDSSFDPDNIKYNCIRYSPVPVANAMGPSWVDPRTGEIINASVYVFHDIVRLLNNWIFVQTAPANKAVRHKELPEKERQEGIQYVVRHEIGHCLGFMHNMGSSASIPVDSLRSPSFTQQYGTTHSIMDYARFNYVAQPGDLEKGVALNPPQFGLYDYYLVKWNYAWFPASVSAADEKATLAKWITDRSGDPRYRYGAQGLQSVDPHSQTEDLGDDAVQASLYGISNLKYIIKNLNSWVGPEDKDYTYRQEIWENVLSQYVRYINHVLNNIGGIYLHEKYEGDPVPFFQSVPRQQQVKAFRFLLDQLADLDWLEDKALLENMTLTGTPATVLRSQVVEALLNMPGRVNLSASKSTEANPFAPKEVMDNLYSFVWKKTSAGQLPNKAEKDVQKAYVAAIIKESKLAPSGAGDASAITDDAFTGIQLPGLHMADGCAHTELPGKAAFGAADPISGFRSLSINFNRAPALESLYYAKILATRQLLTAAVARTADKETAMHYRLLLHQIEKALK